MSAVARVQRSAGGLLQAARPSDRVTHREVRDTAALAFGSVGSGKQMARAIGVSPNSYRATLSKAHPLPASWVEPVRAVQAAAKATVPVRVRLVLAGASRRSQAALDRLGPEVQAFAESLEAKGADPGDVAAALLAVGALRLVRFP